MKFKVIPTTIKTPITTLTVNTIILTHKNEAIIFDPATSLEEIKKIVKNKKVLAVMLTHAHWDHIYTLEHCVKEFNCPVYMHKNAVDKLNNSVLNCAKTHKLNFEVNLNKNQIIFYKNKQGNINLGEFNINYVETFGHSNCSVSFLIKNNIVCGDVLRLHKLARTDLPTSSLIELKNTIEYFKTINKKFMVYNGHDAPNLLSNYLKNAVC